jgi:type II secretory ATPase GspE/PulE/Tfp pilus assembly ATPase PilB-like protein
MFTGLDQQIRAALARAGRHPAPDFEAAWSAALRAGDSPWSGALARAGDDRGALLAAVAESVGLVPVDANATAASPAADGEGCFPLTDPLDVRPLDDAAWRLGREVSGAFVATPSSAGGADDSGSAPELGRQAEDRTVVRLVDRVLADAVRRRAADVHFEPVDDGLQVRVRVDGTLRPTGGAPSGMARAVIARLKVLADLDLAEHRRPQDGRIRFRADGVEADLRLATLPTEGGESAVVRVQAAESSAPALAQLGLPAAVEAGLRASLGRPHGLVVATGPTGSGKTTTLYACLRALNAPDTKVLTVEDPVECALDGAIQVPVNPAAGLTFSRALRAFLRQDPDIILVGEIRDPETARLAVQAALTGHLVLASLHTNDAATAVARLVDLGVEPFLLAATLEAVVAQRLLRQVCTACRGPGPSSGRAGSPDPAAPGMPREAADSTGRSGAPATVCAACDGTGYRGRIGLFELMRVDEPMRALIAAGEPVEVLRARARADGLVPLRVTARVCLAAGLTTAEEIEPLL